jgi:hypothetical protein
MTSTGHLGKTSLRKYRWWITILGFVVLLLIAFFFGLPYLTDRIVQAIYKNAAEPLDREMPVTVTSFRAAPNIVSTIGGMGEGLNCSLPWGFDSIFERPWAAEQRIAVRRRFRQACVYHDLCYRHGLATYGYTQNDCDELIQEQALRICLSVTPDKNLSDCQADAKKVTGGVKIWGFKSYHGWDSSTFFEFDPNPYRSMRFFVTRAIDDPFKAKYPDEHLNDPDQLLLMFSVMRGGVTRSCLNCGGRRISPKEFELAGTQAGEIDAKMSEEEPVWLPTGRFYPAPHVAKDGNGASLLLWLARQTIDDSNFCIVVADPKMVLTGTRPDMAGCYKSANKKLGLGTVDLLSSAPNAALVAPPQSVDPNSLPSLVGTGLTAQRGGLKICVSEDMRDGRFKSNLACHEVSRSTLWGSFQNFPIVRSGRHIYLSRMMRVDQEEGGIDTIQPVAFDLSHADTPADNKQLKIEPVRLEKFDLSDDYDPLLPISSKPSDMRLLGMNVSRSWLTYKLGLSQGTLGLHEIDLASPDPQRARTPIDIVGVDASGKTQLRIQLHESWARRPILVLEPSEGEKAQLALSRSKVTTPSAQPKPGGLDTVQLEFAVLERSAGSTSEQRSFQVVRGLACNVTYTIKKTDRIKPCDRAATSENEQRLTPATRLQGAQLIVGRFAAEADGLTVAMFDRCFLPPEPAPIIAPLLNIGAKVGPKKLPHVAAKNLERDVECRPLESTKRLAERM